MGKTLSNLSFEQWIAYVFDRPVKDPAWYFAIDSDWWEGSPQEKVVFITRAFENAADVLQPFSDEQLNQGLWFIASNGCSDYMFAFLNPGVDWPLRQRGLRSMRNLYQQCFATRCTPHLSHLDEPGANPLNSVCYMWFDLLPIFGMPDDPQRNAVDGEMLSLMGAILDLDHIACQEAALHGLGHWQSRYPAQVVPLIQSFLQRNPGLRSELRQYASSARRGCVQ